MQRGVTCDSALFGRSRHDPRLTTKDENEPRVGQDAILSNIYFRSRRVFAAIFVAIRVARGDEQAEEGQ